MEPFYPACGHGALTVFDDRGFRSGCFFFAAEGGSTGEMMRPVSVLLFEEMAAFGF